MTGEGYEVCAECGDTRIVTSPYDEEIPCPACCPDEYDRAVGFGELAS